MDFTWAYPEAVAMWESDFSSEDKDTDDDVCPDVVETCEEADTEIDDWLARYPGGIPSLYPQLFVVEPPQHLGAHRADSFFRLPAEIRIMIYKHYFNIGPGIHDPVSIFTRDSKSKTLRRTAIGDCENTLKSLLSSALLQSSRLVRFEALPVLFSTRMLSVDWLPDLLRIIKFLGPEGCMMVRHLEVRDNLNFQAQEKAFYRNIISSIRYLPRLDHLRIVLALDSNHDENLQLRTLAWFDRMEEWGEYIIKESAAPKVRIEDIERIWPEYETLMSLRAGNFTMGVEKCVTEEFIEFDRESGAFPELLKSMRSPLPVQADSMSEWSLASNLASINSTTFLTIGEQLINDTFGRADLEDEDTHMPTWQDTDNSISKTIPLYNFLRLYFHAQLKVKPLESYMPAMNFVTFPIAQQSAGSIIRDCAFCYLEKRHCGLHSLPNEPPFDLPSQEGNLNSEEESPETLAKRFQDLSYVEMRETCRGVAIWLVTEPAAEWDVVRAATDYFGWVDVPAEDRFFWLDHTVKYGWQCPKVDKEQIPPWDLLYREVFSFQVPYDVEAEMYTSDTWGEADD